MLFVIFSPCGYLLQVKCVVLGYDKHYSYNKMLKAAAYLAQKDCHFVATNTDAFLPMGEGRNLPGMGNTYSMICFEVCIFVFSLVIATLACVLGTGSLLQGVEVASQRKAIVCGKPNKPIIDVLVKEHGVDPARTIMIGDRFVTTSLLLLKKCCLIPLLSNLQVKEWNF